jgi:hypothetical protein
MKRIGRRKGVRAQVTDILMSALTEVGEPSPPEPGRKRRSGSRAVIAGAALYATGRALASRNGSSRESSGPDLDEDEPRRRTRVRD